MYLMNVPPVATTQTKWRTCGPPGGYSLPICFNDSDTELSTRGTPISDKVQMIIESLRSTQSSLEMGDEMEENVPPGREGHPQVCKVAGASYVGPNSKTKGSTENQVSDFTAPIDHASSDSDSDDSVDRGIEEAILEYLKEKDDHKRKAEPCLAYLQSSKMSRKSPSAVEDSKQFSDSDAFLVASSQLPKSIGADTSPASAVVPTKKHIKNRAVLNENALEKLDSSTSTTNKRLASAREPTSHLSQTFGLFCKAKCPVTADEESNDSSSDDGIEEAIQRYQLEKKAQQHTTETFDPRAFREESDSTSDDGIEEAIRSYQLEQLTEKSVLKPFVHKQQPFATSLIRAVASTRTESIKKHKLRKKKTRAEREARSVQPPPAFIPKSTISEGNRLLLFKGDGFEEHSPLAPPKATTTAELLCAEAILDISKTVMPEAFHHSVGLSSCTPTESSLQSSPPEQCPDEESDATSIDSEDGIELEIRKFLEQKAQMHKQLPRAAPQEPRPVRQPERAKAAVQKRPSRRKHKEENCSVSITSGMENSVREASPKPSPEHRQEFIPLLFTQGSQTHSAARRFKTEQGGGDKSSSLDSDEDLDTAIKDLLKTKKKSKKKTRDLKRKSRMGPKGEEPQLGNPSKKSKATPISNRKKIEKSKIDMKDKTVLSKKRISQHQGPNQSKELDELHEREPAVGGRDAPSPHNTPALETKQDSSSSEDSDDSIEEEIQRFLAEKAKGSTSEKGKDAPRNGTAPVPTALLDEDIKQENQQAEIPPSGQSPARSRLLPTALGSRPEVAASSQTCSPSLLEPAGWVARREQWRPSAGRGDGQGAAPEVERVRPCASPNVAEAIKWRHSLGLPGLPPAAAAADARTASRTPFHITSAKLRETAPAAAPPHHSGGLRSQAPVSAWSAAKTSRAPFPCSAGTNVHAKIRAPVLNRLSSARQHPRTPFASGVAPGHGLQRPAEGERESMVHMSKDESVFVELESNRTNHVQVRGRERVEGKERPSALSEIKREKEESVEIDVTPAHLERTDEFVDEAECESGSRSGHEKKQGFPTLSLSSAIDPGFTFRPCIALTTEERSRMYSRSYQAERYKKVVPSPVKSKALKHVKRRLQFIPVSRKNEAGAPPCNITK